MAKWGAIKLTNKGRELHAKVLAKKLKLEITEIWVSKNNIPDIEEATTITKDKKFDIASLKQDGLDCLIKIAISNQGLTASMPMQSVGIFAKDEDGSEILFSAMVDPEPDTLPSEEDGQLVKTRLNLTIGYSNAEDVVINPTIVDGITQDDLDDGLANKQDKLSNSTDININNNQLFLTPEIIEKFIGEKDLQPNGYMYIGELLIQWGRVGFSSGNLNGAGTNHQYQFPIPFKTRAFAVYASNADKQGSGVDNAYAYIIGRDRFGAATKAQNGVIGNFPVFILAIGI